MKINNFTGYWRIWRTLNLVCLPCVGQIDAHRMGSTRGEVGRSCMGGQRATAQGAATELGKAVSTSNEDQSFLFSPSSFVSA